MALRANVSYNHIMHERVVIVTVIPENIPHVPAADRLSIDTVGASYDGVTHLTARYGFQDEQNIPESLRHAHENLDLPEIDTATASYFLSRITLGRGPERALPTWRKRLFIGLAHNAASSGAQFHLPDDRTVTVGSHVDV